MNFGWFIIQPFSRGILWLLKFFHSFGMNYGVVLILFAFLVRFITGPLTKKSFESTQKMQAIQPQLKKLQEKYIFPTQFGSMLLLFPSAVFGLCPVALTTLTH